MLIFWFFTPKKLWFFIPCCVSQKSLKLIWVTKIPVNYHHKKFEIDRLTIKWSRGCSNGSRKNLNFSYFPGTKIDRKVIKYNKKVGGFRIFRNISTQWHKFDWIVSFTNSQLSKLGFFYPKNNIDLFFFYFCLQKHYQTHKNYSIFLLQSISCHLKHIIIVWKCLKIK